MPTKKEHIKRYMLVDGNAIIHRGFHAIPSLSTKSGEPTNAVYGFTMILLRALSDIKPDFIAVTFDLAAPTFRHKAYAEYKATRVKAPDELYAQFPRCKEVVRSLGIQIFEKEGYEADDILGTLARQIEEEHKSQDGFETLIVTGDLDTLQLVTEHTKVYTLRKGLTDIVIYDPTAVKERYGLGPEQFVDFKAIKGDASDNIPGIDGIGEKGASELIQKFGSLKNIYDHLDELKPKQKLMFEEQKDQGQMSYELSKIDINVPDINPNLDPTVFTEGEYKQTSRLFQELEFRSLISKLPKVIVNKISENHKEIQSEAGSESTIKELSNTSEVNKFNPNYHLIQNIKELEDLAENLLKQKEFAFDTETTGLGAIEFDLVGISFSWKDGEAYYVPAKLIIQTNSKVLHKVFADKTILKIGQNIKYDYMVLRKFGMDVENVGFDTMVASYLLSPGSRAHDLDTMAFNELGYEMQPIEDLIGKGKNQISMSEVPDEKVCFYCCEDVDYTFRLKSIFEEMLKKENLYKIFEEIEIPLIPVLSLMEENGILLDTKLFSSLEKEATKKATDLEKEIFALAGHEFNINSPAQLKVVIFDELKLLPDEAGAARKKNKSGYSTAAGELEKMRNSHPIIKNILAYREMAKLLSTYIKALPEMISKKDGRLHTSFNQTIAATGRLSSSDPNLQNIPVGSEGIASEIRKGFVSAPGKKLLSIDYSQIELRVVAHLSGDETMSQIFKNGEDIHSGTAMQIFGIDDPAKITKEMRRDAKTINFGVLYGVSSFGLSERIESLNRFQAGEFIKKYFQAFPRVELFLSEVVQEARKKGYVENELGRKRYVPEINSSQFMVRAATERAVINMPIQSLAADIIKIAMNRVKEKFDLQSEEIKLLLQVHDELVFEVEEKEIPRFAKEIKEIMENAYKLKVPLIAEAKVGENWGDMKKLEI